ncbi:MAG TPA: LON peptidase substrate-binding domain-containing protein [Phenylobacterium sp.]
MAGGYRKITDLPQVIPIFPLDGALLLPRGDLPLQIFEPRYLNMIDDVMAGDRIVGMVQTRAGGERARPSLVAIGCAGRVTSYAETSDGRYLVTLTGVCRFQVGEELSSRTPYRQVRADYSAFEADLSAPDEPESASERARFVKALKTYLNHRELDIDLETATNAPLDALVTSLSMGLPFDTAEKQALLEAPGFPERYRALTALLEIDALEDGDDEPHSVQ